MSTGRVAGSLVTVLVMVRLLLSRLLVMVPPLLTVSTAAV